MVETHAPSFFTPDNVTVMIIFAAIFALIFIGILLIYSAGAADRRKQDAFEHLRADKELSIAKIQAEAQIGVAQIKAAADLKVAELGSAPNKEIEAP